MSAHTPGPWSCLVASELDGTPYVDDCVRSVGRLQDRGDIVCLSPIKEGFDQSAKRWEENARLIAAAPELLEALVDVIGWIPDGGAWHTEAPMNSLARAREVIAKAKGQQA